MKKPELLVTAGSMEELDKVIRAGADAVLIGESRWGLRLPGDFALPDVEEAVRAAREMRAKVYVRVNKVIENADLPELPGYVGELARIGVDAIVFGDPAVLMACRQAAPGVPLHWNAEMTTTNWAAANYWASKGAVRAVLARELNMEQVLEFKQRANVEVQVQVHGATNIYHSRRALVRSYMTHRGIEGDASNPSASGVSGGIAGTGIEKGLHLVEAERPDLNHPIYEDAGGTHIMSADDICMLEVIDELIEGGIDSLMIEGLMKPVQYNVTAVKAYRAAIDAYIASPADYAPDPAWLDSIRQLQDPARELTYGFFFKEQVY